jgi:hypothetical protein
VTTTYYQDGDGDGFGNAAVTTEACQSPAGYVSDSSDCNDGDAGVHPGAIEYCNEVDDDCDNEVDEDCSIQQEGIFFPVKTKEGEITIIYIE